MNNRLPKDYKFPNKVRGTVAVIASAIIFVKGMLENEPDINLSNELLKKFKKLYSDLIEHGHLSSAKTKLKKTPSENQADD